MNANEKSLVVVKEGIFKEIASFFKKIFHKKDVIQEESIHNEQIKNINTNEKQKEFIQSVKFKEDPDKAMLLKLQDEIEKAGINKENVYHLTKDLTDEQKEKLKELYQTQIKEYEISIENYKRKILNIKRKLATE